MMYLRKVDIAFIVATSALLLVGSAIGWFIFREIVLFFSVAGTMSIVLTTQLSCFRRIQEQSRQHYTQVESLFSLFSSLKIRQPLSPSRWWAISPDFAVIEVSLINERKPKLILEAGSGLSTLIAGYCLQELGDGSLVSLDQEETFAQLSAANIKKHELQGVASVIHAPLKEIAVEGKTLRWFDTAFLQNLGTVDMLIIDGPIVGPDKMDRYPALPILLKKFNLLSHDAVILLDDAFRDKKIIEMWLKDFSDFSLQEFNTEKGTVVLRRSPATVEATVADQQFKLLPK